jgi:transposase
VLAGDGVSNTEIASRTGVSRKTVIPWRARYDTLWLGGLAAGGRSGQPRTLDHGQIATATLNPPPKKLGVTHWSSRLMVSSAAWQPTPPIPMER